MATGSLVIRVEQQLPFTVVAVAGTLTMPAATQLRQTLLKSLADCPDAILIDLAGVQVDSDSPLAVFRAVRRYASTWPAIPVLLCSPRADVADRLARLGIDRALPVYRSRASALAATPQAPSIARADHQLLVSVGAAEEARNLVVEICHAWDLPELADPARLIVSEFVTNAILHGSGPPHLTVVLRHPYLHLIVHDESPDPPVRRSLPPMAHLGAALSGWGLNLVAITADSWGHLASDSGKAVWAVLRCRRSPAVAGRGQRPHVVRPRSLLPRRQGRRR